MQTNYVFIDFENVQPKNIEILAKHPFKIYVFVGASQIKIPTDLATSLQELGHDAKYIRVSGHGPNALDFHITYYLGKLVAEEPEAYFHIISKDKGYDALITHLQGQGIKIQREKDLAEIPILRTSHSTSDSEKVSTIVKNLIGRGQSKPRKVQTLANTINTLFTKRLEEKELLSLIEQLKQKKYIVINGSNISYRLPKAL